MFSCCYPLGACASLHLGFNPGPWGSDTGANLQQWEKQRSPLFWHQQSMATPGLFIMLLYGYMYMRCTISELVLFGARALSFQFLKTEQCRAIECTRLQPGCVYRVSQWLIGRFIWCFAGLGLLLWAWQSPKNVHGPPGPTFFGWHFGLGRYWKWDTQGPLAPWNRFASLSVWSEKAAISLLTYSFSMPCSPSEQLGAWPLWCSMLGSGYKSLRKPLLLKALLLLRLSFFFCSIVKNVHFCCSC